MIPIVLMWLKFFANSKNIVLLLWVLEGPFVWDGGSHLMRADPPELRNYLYAMLHCELSCLFGWRNTVHFMKVSITAFMFGGFPACGIT